MVNHINKFETNVIHKLEEQIEEDEFGELSIRNVWDQAGKKSRKLLRVQIGKTQWEKGFQIDRASPVLFISQKKLHGIKIQDRYLAVKAVPNDHRNEGHHQNLWKNSSQY